MKTGKSTKKIDRKRLRRTYLGCAMTRNRSAWCFRLCIPDGEGNGRCGRLAPHHLRSRIQMSIERHKARLDRRGGPKPRLDG